MAASTKHNNLVLLKNVLIFFENILTYYYYQQWLDWCVRKNDIKQLWAAQPTYIISQAVYVLAGLLTLFHGEYNS